MNINTLQSVSPMILGPAPYFRLEGSTLRVGPDDRVVATYRRHHWQVEGHHASSYECRDRTRVYFANPDGEQSKLLGPFARLHFPNGSCYADDFRIAEYAEESEHWLNCEDSTPWSAIVISPA
jgi:hypothetical protein